MVELLPDASLVLTLERVCVQNTARHAHRELTLALLQEQDQENTGALSRGVDLLELFLSTVDFPNLRTRHPELASGSGCRVRLWRKGDGGVGWEMLEGRGS